jgi:hypothetical protein
LPESNIAEKTRKYALLNTINRNFISVASAYSRIIISELFVDDELKTIKRSDACKGFAGGLKYVCRGILFKIATGLQGPYSGNDEVAAKAMGHELKGANSYSRCNIADLNVTLQAVIDYNGFRIHAQALLYGIGAHTTLQVGSCDGGRTVVNK